MLDNFWNYYNTFTGGTVHWASPLGLISLSAITGSPDGGCEQNRSKDDIGNSPSPVAYIWPGDIDGCWRIKLHICALLSELSMWGLVITFVRINIEIYNYQFELKQATNWARRNPCIKGVPGWHQRNQGRSSDIGGRPFLRFGKGILSKMFLLDWAENKKGAIWKSGSVTGTQILVCALGRKMTIAGIPPSGPQAIV